MPSALPHSYFPAFSTREGELKAFKELDPSILDRIVPVVTLTREREAPSLAASLYTVVETVGSRPIIIDFDHRPRPLKTPQEIQAERARKAEERREQGKPPFNYTDNFEARLVRQRQATVDFNRSIADLQSSSNGYENWRAFSLSYENVIPIVKMSDPAQIAAQVRGIVKAGRKMAFRVDVTDPGSIATFLVAAPHIDRSDRAVIILDAGYIRGSVGGAEIRVTKALKDIQNNIPAIFDEVVKVCMAGSFPSSLLGLTSPLVIEERNLFDRVRNAGWGVRYGDHASVQPRSDQDFGNGFYAHVEVAHRRSWYFDRASAKSKASEYQKCALALVNNAVAWGGRCKSWGTDAVERVAQHHSDDGRVPPFKLSKPGRWVGVRVSQHITQQALHP